MGAGQMGHGIAHVNLRTGHNVFTSQDFGDAGAKRIIKGLAREVEEGWVTKGRRQQALTRLNATAVAADLAEVDITTEAVTERFDSPWLHLYSLQSWACP